MALYNGMVLKRGKCMIEMIANELKLHSWQVEHTLSLLEEGNTVPFIARYRKEMTGGLDEEQIRKIEELKENTLRLEKRREDVLRLLKEQGVLDEGLNKAILACEKISQIDDLYRPYQQKKKTRAMLAKEAGLEPLAEWIRKFYRDADIQKEKNVSQVGGGSMPLEKLDTYTVTIKPNKFSVSYLEKRLRKSDAHIIGRINEDKYILDVRTIEENEFDLIVKELKIIFN